MEYSGSESAVSSLGTVGKAVTILFTISDGRIEVPTKFESE